LHLLEFDLSRASRIVSTCALLHGYFVDNSDNEETDTVQSEAKHQYAVQAHQRWWTESQHLRSASHSGSGAISDLQRRKCVICLLLELKMWYSSSSGEERDETV
jgi:hypothetical protein